MNFKEYLNESKTESKSKNIRLFTQRVELNVKSESIGKKQYQHYLVITSTTDPNVSGKVRYDSMEKARKAFRYLNTASSILNYMKYSMENNSQAFGWGPLLRSELHWIMNNMTSDEISKLNLDFDLKSYKKEMETEPYLGPEDQEASEEPVDIFTSKGEISEPEESETPLPEEEEEKPEETPTEAPVT